MHEALVDLTGGVPAKRKMRWAACDGRQPPGPGDAQAGEGARGEGGEGAAGFAASMPLALLPLIPLLLALRQWGGSEPRLQRGASRRGLVPQWCCDLVPSCALCLVVSLNLRRAVLSPLCSGAVVRAGGVAVHWQRRGGHAAGQGGAGAGGERRGGDAGAQRRRAQPGGWVRGWAWCWGLGPGRAFSGGGGGGSAELANGVPQGTAGCLTEVGS